jgi:transglutaminase-like putative cysteine protease
MKILPCVILVALTLLAAAAIAQDDPYRSLIDEIGSDGIYKDAAVAVVFDSTKILVENSGLSHVTNHRLLKVLSWDGARRLNALRFDYDPASNVLEPRMVSVHRADGKIETVDPDGAIDAPQPQSMIYWGPKMKVLDLPRLNVGDAVEMETYKKGFQIAYLEEELPQADEERYIPPQRGHFYDVIHFQGDDPIREKSYTMRISRGIPAQYAVYNEAVFSSVTFEDTLLVYTFWKQNVPAVKHEPGQPDASDFVAKVVLATVKDWPEKSRWFFGVNDSVFAANDDVRAKAVEITKTCKTEDEKIASVLHWTAQNIRYSGISMGKGEGYTLHPGIMTLNDRCGVCKDIAGMSITLLRAAGFTVYPAMTMAGARVEMIPADQFNHCVVAVKRSDGSYTMIDPTWAPYDPDVWSAAEGEQHYVIGSPGGETRMAIRSYKPEENLCAIDLKGTLNSAGDLEGTIVVTGKTYGDTRIRRGIAYTPLQDQQRMFAGWVAKIAPDAEVLSATYSKLLDLSKPVRLEIKFRAPGYALKAGNDLLYSPAAAKFAQAAPRPFSLLNTLTSDERTNPLMIWNTRQVLITESISVPNGFQLASPPAKRNEGDKVASCKTETKLVKNVLSSTVDYKLAQRTVPPKDYLQVKKAFDTLKDFSRETWQLKKGS